MAASCAVVGLFLCTESRDDERLSFPRCSSRKDMGYTRRQTYLKYKISLRDTMLTRKETLSKRWGQRRSWTLFVNSYFTCFTGTVVPLRPAPPRPPGLEQTIHYFMDTVVQNLPNSIENRIPRMPQGPVLAGNSNFRT